MHLAISPVSFSSWIGLRSGFHPWIHIDDCVGTVHSFNSNCSWAMDFHGRPGGTFTLHAWYHDLEEKKVNEKKLLTVDWVTLHPTSYVRISTWKCTLLSLSLIKGPRIEMKKTPRNVLISSAYRFMARWTLDGMSFESWLFRRHCDRFQLEHTSSKISISALVVTITSILRLRLVQASLQLDHRERNDEENCSVFLLNSEFLIFETLILLKYSDIKW